MVDRQNRRTPTKLAKAFVRILLERSIRFAAPGAPETQPTQCFLASPVTFAMVFETARETW